MSWGQGNDYRAWNIYGRREMLRFASLVEAGRNVCGLDFVELSVQCRRFNWEIGGPRPGLDKVNEASPVHRTFIVGSECCDL